ncbi:hypothetical protein E2L07_18205 [Halalkalibacterium halodurans]|uniref:toprim domain-containing protein n=1 Tax=Halalkalibacterium halodurans TaxID=86665 RepID=UPI0010678A84|nr:toprim domain-containing protein [Halalkalibacterium halodurans]TES48800.1 hypothetical protein E2L07_18205 [Halalkalibacterium halodurans]
MVNQLEFRNIDDMLESLNAQPQGRYFLCTCPSCNQPEAFMYKDNLNVLQCNRQNNCGERWHIKLNEKLKGNLNLKKNEKPKSISLKQKEQIDWCTNFFKFMSKHVVNQELENYRGINREVTKPFILDLKDPKIVSLMFSKIPDLIKKDYAKMDFMTKRNIVFPIYNHEGSIDSLLLRSSDPSLKKKEIQLFLNPTEKARYFVEDIPDNAETVVISESIIDGLSFREIDPKMGLLMTTGSNKIKQLETFIKENPDKFKGKKIIRAFDNDRAGKEADKKIAHVLDEEKLFHKGFIYPDMDLKDPNDLLQSNRLLFERQIELTLRTLDIDLKKEEGEKMNDKTEQSNDYKVKIVNMTFLQDKGISLACVKYGEITLNNIVIEEYKGSPMINYPQKKGTDSVWRDVYRFEESLDKRMIEGALIKSYYELKHQVKEKNTVKNVGINISSGGGKFDPKIIHSHTFSNGNISVNIGYRNLIVNGIVTGKSKGKDYVSTPYYFKGDKINSFVKTSKDFSNKILDLTKPLKTKNKEKESQKEVG